MSSRRPKSNSGGTVIDCTSKKPACWKKSSMLAGFTSSEPPGWHSLPTPSHTQCAAVSTVRQPTSTALQNSRCVARSSSAAAVGKSWVSTPLTIRGTGVERVLALAGATACRRRVARRLGQRRGPARARNEREGRWSKGRVSAWREAPLGRRGAAHVACLTPRLASVRRRRHGARIRGRPAAELSSCSRERRLPDRTILLRVRLPRDPGERSPVLDRRHRHQGDQPHQLAGRELPLGARRARACWSW